MGENGIVKSLRKFAAILVAPAPGDPTLQRLKTRDRQIHLSVERDIIGRLYPKARRRKIEYRYFEAITLGYEQLSHYLYGFTGKLP